MTVLRHLAAHWAEFGSVRAFVNSRAAEDPDPHVRSDVLRQVVMTWPDDPGLPDLLRHQALQDTEPWVRQAAFSLLPVCVDAQEVQNFAVSALIDESRDEGVRQSAAESLATKPSGVGNEELCELLTRLAASESSSKVRGAVQEALAVRFGDRPTVRKYLLDLVTTDPDVTVRGMVLNSLAKQCGAAPEVRTVVLAHASDSESPLRLEAIRAFISTRWKDGPEERALILRWATEGSRTDVRAAVLRALSNRRPNDSDIQTFLVGRLSSEPKAALRQELLSRLVMLNPDDRSTLDAVQRSAVDDPDEKCRTTALVSLCVAWIGRDSERRDQTRSFVAARAADDPHPKVRESAQDFLDQFWPSPSAVLTPEDALRRRALEDATDSCFEHLQEQLHQSPHEVVRVTAAQLMATCWAPEPRTVPALTEQAEAEENPGIRAEIEAAVTTATVYAPVHDLLF
ncbi:HEAT repeat domain-containing protein [Streptomyces sp. DSM 110735]|uniref:HEAT repeat domain-containing protein n=1 Tax=Streptomyces sp. DSM 110735 TaxID=2775031 RepID=UPI0018F39762|nr:HEAT repeat domain-containing protein [Streptomyces sp. DSM 110735]MBJ7902368.1 HEAT repeat domain-containing protein [Streptomyces sp. DSM 110735]